MSRTYCRFCDMTVQGIYVNCPRCGKWLPPQEFSDPLSMMEKTPPEPFKVVKLGPSWEGFVNATVILGKLSKPHD